MDGVVTCPVVEIMNVPETCRAALGVVVLMPTLPLPAPFSSILRVSVEFAEMRVLLDPSIQYLLLATEPTL
jgi:hypothetical protein